VLSLLMQCAIAPGLVGLLGLVAVYSLAFAEGNGFIVHGVGGGRGATATGLCKTPFARPEGVTCWASQVGRQLPSVGFTTAYELLVTVVILYGLKAILGHLRPTDEQEFAGVDLSEHSEMAYTSHQ
jgi:ammonia channel protein AmtB